MTDDSRRSPRSWIDALLFVIVLVPTWISAQPVYRITDIGTLVGADDMFGAEINEYRPGDGHCHRERKASVPTFGMAAP